MSVRTGATRADAVVKEEVNTTKTPKTTLINLN